MCQKVEEAELLNANPNYVHVCLQNGCGEITVSLINILKQVFTMNFNVEVISIVQQHLQLMSCFMGERRRIKCVFYERSEKKYVV